MDIIRYYLFKNFTAQKLCNQQFEYASKVCDCSRERPEGSLFINYYNEGVRESATLFSELPHFTLD